MPMLTSAGRKLPVMPKVSKRETMAIDVMAFEMLFSVRHNVSLIICIIRAAIIPSIVAVSVFGIVPVTSTGCPTRAAVLLIIGP